MMGLIAKFAGPAIAGILLGYWIGAGMERAEWTEFTKALAEETAEAARAAKDLNDARIEAIREQHKIEVADFQRVLAETQRSEQNARRLARQLRERIDGIREEFVALRARFTGASACRFDPDDIRVLNDAVQAANRDRGPGVPRAPEANSP